MMGAIILIKGEKIPESWPVFDTTGYDFLNVLNGIFVDTTNAKIFDDNTTGSPGPGSIFRPLFMKRKINYGCDSLE